MVYSCHFVRFTTTSFLILFDQKFGVTPNEVEETLESGDYQSHLAIAYRLVVDNKHIEEKHAIEEFKYVGGFALGLVGHPVFIFCGSRTRYL